MPPSEDYYEGLNEDLLLLLPDTARRILDVGCGAGRLGEAIKQKHPDAIVHGIEREPEVAERAAEVLDRVFEADLDYGLPELDRPYDAILCGDVLEHLVDPWSRLEDLVGHLAPNGSVVASLPNVRHYKVVRDLLFDGRFRYRDKGILDRTHLRFFTRRSMHELFEGAGLKVLVEKPRLGGNNLFWRCANIFLGGGHDELRAVQYTLRGVPERTGD